MTKIRILAAVAAVAIAGAVALPAVGQGNPGSITITSPVTGDALGAAGVVTWTYETGSQITDGSIVHAGLKIDGPEYTEVGSASISDEALSIDTSSLVNGIYTLRLTVEDSVKQFVVEGILLDVVAPTIDVSVDPSECDAAWCAAELAMVTVTAADEGGLAEDPSGSYPVTDEGLHEMSFTATDLAGNSTVATVSVQMDRTAPVIEASIEPAACGAPGWCSLDEAVVTVGAFDELSGLAQDPSGSTSVIDEGVNVLSFTATDLAGNSTTIEVTVQIDRTGPITIIDPIDPPVLVTPLGQEITGSANDNFSGVASTMVTFTNELLGESVVLAAECNLCGATAATWAVSTEGMLPGLYSVSATSADVAGNEGEPSLPLQVLIV